MTARDADIFPASTTVPARAQDKAAALPRGGERRFAAILKPRLDGWSWVLVSFVACISLIVIVLPAIVLWLSFREAHPVEPVSHYSFLHYIEVFGDPFILRVLGNTL